ncbi:MAG: tetratricopeptide repeat protein [Dysgonamonadaceae bacterium]|nr:tetratricopeptide repeat protein [Dysgonamonadaceae bacterium]MDD3309459.1 tetratricopeptide repeat protein [Dysgonamonadaceae bacterium]MDD3900044.1 tetratricopeptide repeat protein [Dysgonamonadaceae bacterium]MDD4398794.1 tetratricopeptide repeat protein [Dysgonamonadaceae bacterium]
MKQFILIISLLTCFSYYSFAQKNDKTLINEGVELHDSLEFEKAIDKYNEALKLNPESMLAKYELALSYLELKDYNNAIKYATDVIESGNSEILAESYNVKSEALVGLNKIDEAIQLLNEGIKKTGNHFFLQFNLALNYYKKRDLENALKYVRQAIDMSKSSSGAFLLNAYITNDIGLWVQSLLSFQMFLTLEPDSKRSQNAFEEMMQIMRIKPTSGKPIERSFVQLQMNGGNDSTHIIKDIPPLNIEDGLDRKAVWDIIQSKLNQLNAYEKEPSLYLIFTEVNKAIVNSLEKTHNGPKEGAMWIFFVPFFTQIVNSEHYETYCKYISVSYFPESLEWWNTNKDKGEEFKKWFENGDD